MDSILQKGGASYDEMQGGIWVPGTSDVVLVPGETVPLTDVVMAGDPNLVPENIKLGVPIFDVIGTWNEFQSEDGFYLKNLNEMTDVTGGYAYYIKNPGNGLDLSSGTLTRNDTGLFLNAHTFKYDSKRKIGFNSVNKIDVTNIRRIAFKGIVNLTMISYGPNWDAEDISGTVYSCSSLRVSVADANHNQVASATISGRGGSKNQYPFELTIDLANIAGMYYIDVHFYGEQWNTSWYYSDRVSPGSVQFGEITYETMPTV